MRNQSSIDIDRPASEVFEYVTEPKNAAYWQVQVKRFELVNRTSGVGNQTRWVMDAGPYESEVIETCVAFDPPTTFASKHQLTRFLSGPAPSPGDSPLSRDDLRAHFQSAYGRREVGGLVVVNVTPTGPDSCNLEFRMETQIGGTAWVVTRIQKLFGRNALKESLAKLKHLLEA